MRGLSTVIFAVVLYLVFLAWRFPYQAAVDQAVHRFEQSTGAVVEYIPKSASLFGVTLQDVKVHWPSGLEAKFSKAVVHTGLSAITASLTQMNGTASAVLDHSGKLDLALDKIQIESGSQELGTVRATGDLSYSLVRRDGAGDLRLEVPKFRASLPIPELSLDIGTKITATYKELGHEVRADVHAVAQDFGADGPVLVEPQPGALPPRLSGTLQMKAGPIKGTLRLEGTWKKPQFSLVNGN